MNRQGLHLPACTSPALVPDWPSLCTSSPWPIQSLPYLQFSLTLLLFLELFLTCSLFTSCPICVSRLFPPSHSLSYSLFLALALSPYFLPSHCPAPSLLLSVSLTPFLALSLSHSLLLPVLLTPSHSRPLTLFLDPHSPLALIQTSILNRL